jgi:DNA-binding response OmpR family regulator
MDVLNNHSSVGHKKSILIIEDDINFANFLKYLIEESGYNAIVANDSAQANRILLKQQPDLITLDLVLPGETGIKLFRRLRSSQNWKDIPIIVITGVDSATNKEISYKSFLKGVKLKPPEAYIEKPIEQQRLLNAIEKIIADTHC